MKKGLLLAALLSISLPSIATTVEVETTLGNFTLELNDERAPITVENFLEYVRRGSYVGTQFHRVIPGFMVQGGGFDKEMNKLETMAPIKNESTNGLSNQKATISMARTSDPDSAARQFFINVRDNSYLDGSASKPGYAVFGTVTKGYGVVREIEIQPTHTVQPYKDVPVTPVIITDMKILKD